MIPQAYEAFLKSLENIDSELSAKNPDFSANARRFLEKSCTDNSLHFRLKRDLINRERFSGSYLSGLFALEKTPCEVEFKLIKTKVEFKFTLKSALPANSVPFKFCDPFKVLIGTIYDENTFSLETIEFDSLADPEEGFNFQTGFGYPDDGKAANFSASILKMRCSMRSDENTPEPLRLLLPAQRKEPLCLEGKIFDCTLKSGVRMPKIFLESPEKFHLKYFPGKDIRLHFLSFLPEGNDESKAIWPVSLARLSFQQDVSFRGEKKTLIFAGNFFQNSPFALTLECIAGKKESISIEDVVGLLETIATDNAPSGPTIYDGLKTMIPNDFLILDSLNLKQIGLNLVFTAATFELQSIDVEIDIIKSIDFKEFLKIEKSYLVLRVSNPISTKPGFFLELRGEATIPKLSNQKFSIGIDLPSTEFFAQLPPSVKFDVIDIFSKILPDMPKNNLPKAVVTDIRIKGQVITKSFGFTTTIATDFRIPFIEGSISLNSLTIQAYPFGNGLQPSFSGSFNYKELRFYLGAFPGEDKKSWDLQLFLQEGKIEPIAVLREFFGNLLPPIPSITLGGLKMNINTSGKIFTFFSDADIPFDSDLLPVETANVQLKVVKDGLATPKISLVSHLYLADQLFELSADVGEKIENFSGAWLPEPGVKFTLVNLLNGLLGSTPDFFSNFALELSSIKLENDVKKKSLSVEIDFGENLHGKITKKVGAEWSLGVGFFTLAKLTEVFSDFRLLAGALDKIKPQSMSFLYCSTPAPVAALLDLRSDVVINPQVEAVQGAQIVVDFSIAKFLISPLTDLFGNKNIFRVCLSGGGLSAPSGFNIEPLPDIYLPSKEVSLLKIASVKVEIGLTTVPISLVIKGQTSISIFTSLISISEMTVTVAPGALTGSAAIGKTSLSIPGLSAIDIRSATLLVSKDATGFGLGASGILSIGEKDGNFAVVWDPKSGEVPKYLAFSIREIGFEDIFKILIGKEGKLPSSLSIKDVLFNLSTTIQTLPDGTAANPGLCVFGLVDIFGMKGLVDIKGSAEFSDPDIHAQISLSPINLSEILKISGKGKGYARKQNEQGESINTCYPQPDPKKTKPVEFIKPGGPNLAIDFLKGKMNGTWEILLFGLRANEEVSLSKDGISFHVEGDTGPFAKLFFDCNLGTAGDFSTKSDFTAGLDFKLKINPFGIHSFKVHIQATMTGDIAIKVKTTHEQSIAANVKFGFMGLNFSLHLESQNVKVRDLSTLMKILVDLIAEKIKNQIEELFEHPENFLEAFGKKLLSELGNPKKLIEKGFGWTEKAAKNWLNGHNFKKAWKKLKKILNPAKWL